MFEPDALIVRADVHIVDINPPIARTLELPMDLKLAQLHEVLQAAFGTTAIFISSTSAACPTALPSSTRTARPAVARSTPAR